MNNRESNQSDITSATKPRSSNVKCAVIGIYGLRNKTTGKWYIGQSWDIHNRWKAYRKMRCKPQRKLYAAILKYGIDDFEMSILRQTCPSQIVLDRVETELIKQYDSIENGYNIKLGGHRGRHSEETKKRIGEGNIGKVMSEESKEKCRQSRLGQKLSESALNNWKSSMKALYERRYEERRKNPPKYERACPCCGKTLSYSSNKLRNKANRKNQPCRSCTQKTEAGRERVLNMNSCRIKMRTSEPSNSLAQIAIV